MHTAFHKEDDLGDPVAQDQLGAVQEQPVTSKSEAPRLAQEEQVKKFNRNKMGGFLMEFGLNILASNRDDAGGAVGEAGTTMLAQGRERKRARAAEGLAAEERERKQRREDEADSLKQEKAAREVAKAARDERKEERDISKSELDKLERFYLADGSVAFYEKKEGVVYDSEDPETRKEIKVDKKTRGYLTAGQSATGVYRARARLDAKMAEIAPKGRVSPRNKEAIKAIGKSPSNAELAEYALGLLDEVDRLIIRNDKDDGKIIEYESLLAE